MLGLPRWLSGKEPACECKRRGFDPWVGKIPWRRKWQLTPVFLPGKSHGQRSLAGYSPRGRKRVGHASVTKQQEEEIWRSANPSVIHLHFYFNWLTIISTTKPIPYSGDVVSANWNRVDVFPWWFRIAMIFFFSILNFSQGSHLYSKPANSGQKSGVRLRHTLTSGLDVLVKGR